MTPTPSIAGRRSRAVTLHAQGLDISADGKKTLASEKYRSCF